MNLLWGDINMTALDGPVSCAASTGEPVSGPVTITPSLRNNSAACAVCDMFMSDVSTCELHKRQTASTPYEPYESKVRLFKALIYSPKLHQLSLACTRTKCVVLVQM